MKHYTQVVKAKAIAKLLPPNNMSISAVAKETGISDQTLYNWRNQKRKKGLVVPVNIKESSSWSSADKFSVVIETSNMNIAQLSEYCRQKGIYPEQVAQWKEACLNANEGEKKPSKAEKKRAAKELQRVKRLERELIRKDKALAEAAALLLLQKKVQEIWGGDEED